MNKTFFGTLLVVGALAACPMGISYAGSHDATLTFVSAVEQEPAVPAAKSPPASAEEEKKPAAAAKGPSTIDTIKDLGTGFAQEVGITGSNVGTWFKETAEGYKGVFDEATKKAMAERDERAKAGKTNNVVTDFAIGFKHGFVESVKYSWSRWAWPAIKTIFKVFSK